MNLGDLKKKPVVSMSEGAKVGEVDDLLIETASWTVRELYVMGKSAAGLLPLVNVKAIGPDAVTIEASDTVAWNAGSSGLCFEAMKGLHVVDGAGTTIGHVGDLVYDRDGRIDSFEVRQGGVLGVGAKITKITPTEIRGVGEKLLTVELAGEPSVTTTPVTEDPTI